MSGHIYQLAAAIWRRRRLILVPLLVSIPLSVIAASLMPKKYVATTLLLLQEGGGDNPLQSSPNRVDGMDGRMAGLEALLKSEYILLPALEVIMGDKFPSNPRMQALEMQSLKDALTIELIGKSFMRLNLRGSKPERLGDALGAITTSFMDSLLTANQGPPVVTQFLLDQHKARLEAAQKSLNEFKAEIGGTDPSLLPLQDPERLGALTRQLAAAKADVAKADAEVSSLAAATGREVHSLSALEVDITNAGQALDKAVAASEPEAKLDELRNYLEQLKKLADKVRVRDGLESEVGRIAAEHQALEAKLAEHTNLIEKAARLEKNLAEATARYQSFSDRYANADAAARRALKVLESPESIRVIDPPKDPELGLMSRVIYVMAGILAGLGVGCSGAVVAEVLDRRLRRPEDVAQAFDSPVICHLPAFDPSEAEEEPDELPSNVAQLPRIERPADTPRASG